MIFNIEIDGIKYPDEKNFESFDKLLQYELRK